MRRVRDELTRHCGGHPNVSERLLIERAVIFSLRCAQIDTKIIAGELLSLHDSNCAIAWSNGLRRCLVALGVESRTASPMMDAISYGRMLGEEDDAA